jgi:hypothetical protein
MLVNDVCMQEGRLVHGSATKRMWAAATAGTVTLTGSERARAQAGFNLSRVALCQA